MQFHDVNPDTGARATVVATPNDVVFALPVSLAKRAGIEPDAHVTLRFGKDGDKRAVLVVPTTAETAWKVRGRRQVVQIHAKQLMPSAQIPKTELTSLMAHGGLVLNLPTGWEVQPDAVDDQPPPATAKRRA